MSIASGPDRIEDRHRSSSAHECIERQRRGRGDPRPSGPNASSAAAGLGAGTPNATSGTDPTATARARRAPARPRRRAKSTERFDVETGRADDDLAAAAVDDRDRCVGDERGPGAARVRRNRTWSAGSAYDDRAVPASDDDPVDHGQTQAAPRSPYVAIVTRRARADDPCRGCGCARDRGRRGARGRRALRRGRVVRITSGKHTRRTAVGSSGSIASCGASTSASASAARRSRGIGSGVGADREEPVTDGTCAPIAHSRSAQLAHEPGGSTSSSSRTTRAVPSGPASGSPRSSRSSAVELARPPHRRRAHVVAVRDREDVGELRRDLVDRRLAVAAPPDQGRDRVEQVHPSARWITASPSSSPRRGRAARAGTTTRRGVAVEVLMTRTGSANVVETRGARRHAPSTSPLTSR